MNCQDIARIVDTGSFGALTAMELRECEAHAHTCPRCAPLWMSHARLATLPIPAMPQEIAARCATLAASRPQNSAPSRASRRMIFTVGGLVALAAAASMLALNLGREPASHIHAGISAALPAASDAGTRGQDIRPTIPGPEAAMPAMTDKAAYSLPLLPAPIRANEEQMSQIELALRKALDLYPEIANGPEIKGHFVVMLTLRADGTVLGNSMVIVTSDDEVNAEMLKATSFDSGQLFAGRRKGFQVPDGRILRGELTVGLSMVANDYDASRSGTRVREIIRKERAHMMRSTDAAVSKLTVFLSEDGSIQRENVEFIGTQELRQNGPSPGTADRRAQDMARKLGIEVDQIGLMGFTYLQEGSPSDTASGQRILTVDYAWPRKAGETAPRYGQSANRSPGTSSGMDPAAALAIAERVLPDAFMRPGQTTQPDGPAINRPVVVLSAEGRVLGAGRMNLADGETMRREFQRIVPGVEIYMTNSSTVINRAGDRAQVMFAWEATPAQKQAQENARKAASDR